MKIKSVDPDNKKVREIKSYSVEEILAAGGPAAFAERQGKDVATLIKALEDTQKPEPFFTDEEWDEIMDDLAKNK
jgi:hypothetical protein